jgi:hypothetical protein
MSLLDALPIPPSLALGFSFEETMSGSYHLLSSQLDERAISFTLGARVAGIRKFAKDRLARVEGEVYVEKFAEHRPFEGTLALRLLDERRLTYDFTFRGNDGHEYRFHGQKDVTLLSLLETMTTLPASIYDGSGAEIARAVLRFDTRGTLGSFLRSWRLRMGMGTGTGS